MVIYENDNKNGIFCKPLHCFSKLPGLGRFLTYRWMKSPKITILMEERGYDRRITEWRGRLIRLEVRVNGEEEKQGSLNLTTFFLLIFVWCPLFSKISLIHTWSKTKNFIQSYTHWHQIWNIKGSIYIYILHQVLWSEKIILNDGLIPNLGTHAIANIGLYFALLSNDLLVCKLLE